MKIIVAPNAFKGSLSAVKAAEAIAAGLLAVFPEREIVQVPLADGGDGTVECLVQSTGGKLFRKTVTGPLGDPVEAVWGLTGDGTTAVVEVAAASGLALLAPEQRDPLRATTFGTGELIVEALISGCSKVFVGLGGSATNDAGAGILQALGVKLLDEKSDEIGFGAAELLKLHSINISGLTPLVKNIEIEVGCDVDNPLYGPRGAAYIYAPQKGAAEDQLPFLDSCLRRFAAVVKSSLDREVGNLPGGGAAGGIGAGLAGVLGARLVPGIEKIMQLTGLPSYLEQGGVDLIITGEGEINHQSLHGKVPVGVAGLAKEYGVPVLVLAGRVNLSSREALQAGITAMLAIVDGPIPLTDAMQRTGELLKKAAKQAALLFQAGENSGLKRSL